MQKLDHNSWKVILGVHAFRDIDWSTLHKQPMADVWLPKPINMLDTTYFSNDADGIDLKASFIDKTATSPSKKSKRNNKLKTIDWGWGLTELCFSGKTGEFWSCCNKSWLETVGCRIGKHDDNDADSTSVSLEPITSIDKEAT